MREEIGKREVAFERCKLAEEASEPMELTVGPTQLIALHRPVLATCVDRYVLRNPEPAQHIGRFAVDKLRTQLHRDRSPRHGLRRESHRPGGRALQAR